ncbi:unnamed protein product [Notodromas monacha]|uniref:Adenosine kinase n=1 Tax=Notodromas monacha TaxID=399045 RepID=A0A7R9BJ51_9CRUS|nr:unnamed protein product [Notodromas monacha]CAG0915597.1 unnamed protein product [Notodromas monacha]
MLRAAINSAKPTVMHFASRNMRMAVPACQAQVDPIQKIFVDKIKEYASKSKSAKDGLVDADNDALKGLHQEIDRVNKTFGFKEAAEVEKLPTFNFSEPAIENPAKFGVRLSVLVPRMTLRAGLLLGMGNPLLDISVECDKAFLEKYGMKANDAILAEEKHLSMYDEMKRMDGVQFTAGGATQNSMRICQWMSGMRRVASFMGCVGTDENSTVLAEKMSADGVFVRYQKTSEQPTGTCAVVVTDQGKSRSLCANLGAANCFTVDHLDVDEHWKLVENADFFYIAGFFLTVSTESILKVSEHALKSGKTFCMNLAAPFISQFYRDRLLSVFPRIDILFGNETEFETFAEEEKLGTTDRIEIGKKLSQYPKDDAARKRLVVITQGELPVICVQGDEVTIFDVPHIPEEQIVDTNGAGDSFVGGFLSKYIIGKPLEDCVNAGIWAAHQIIARPGLTFPEKCAVEKSIGNFIVDVRRVGMDSRVSKKGDEYWSHAGSFENMFANLEEIDPWEDPGQVLGGYAHGSIEAEISANARSGDVRTSAFQGARSMASEPEQEKISKLMSELKLVNRKYQDRFAPMPTETVRAIMMGRPYSLECYKTFADKTSLLDEALYSGDGNAILAAVLHIKKTMKRTLLVKALQRRPVAAQHLLHHMKQRAENMEVLTLCNALGRKEDASMFQYALAVEQDPSQRIKALKSIVKDSSLSEHDTAIVNDHISLLERVQLPVDAADRSGNSRAVLDSDKTLVGSSLQESVYYCTFYHWGVSENHLACPGSLKKLFQMSDRQFHWPVLRALANRKQWNQIIETFIVKKTLLRSARLKGDIPAKEFLAILRSAEAPATMIDVVLSVSPVGES